MLYDEIADPEAKSPEEVRAEYETELAETIASVGADEVADRSGVDSETVSALADGDSSGLTVEEAAAILATDDDAPQKDDIVLEVRDHLLMGMTTAVLDVDTIAADVEMDGARTVQQKIEGRREMTLAEYARLHHYIASQKDR